MSHWPLIFPNGAWPLFLQYSTVQYSTVQYSTVQYSTTNLINCYDKNMVMPCVAGQYRQYLSSFHMEQSQLDSMVTN